MRKVLCDIRGDAVVEATILFPIMILVFAALVLLAIYLPTRSALQYATQYTATAIATEWSDTWLFYDDGTMDFYWEDNINRLENVYKSLFSSPQDPQPLAFDLVSEIETRSISSKSGDLTVNAFIENKILYREVIVTANRVFRIPINLSIILFPETIQITVSSTAVVQDGDEFIRNADMADDFVGFISDNFGLSDLGDTIGSFGSQTSSLLGF